MCVVGFGSFMAFYILRFFLLNLVSSLLMLMFSARTGVDRKDEKKCISSPGSITRSAGTICGRDYNLLGVSRSKGNDVVGGTSDNS